MSTIIVQTNNGTTRVKEDADEVALRYANAKAGARALELTGDTDVRLWFVPTGIVGWRSVVEGG